MHYIPWNLWPTAAEAKERMLRSALLWSELRCECSAVEEGMDSVTAQQGIIWINIRFNLYTYYYTFNVSTGSSWGDPTRSSRMESVLVSIHHSSHSQSRVIAWWFCCPQKSTRVSKSINSSNQFLLGLLPFVWRSCRSVSTYSVDHQEVYIQSGESPEMGSPLLPLMRPTDKDPVGGYFALIILRAEWGFQVAGPWLVGWTCYCLVKWWPWFMSSVCVARWSASRTAGCDWK